MITLNKRGFTLIELLVVIGIIGILAGIVIAVINPALQRRKANETVLRTNMNKICLAWNACLAASSTGLAPFCDTPAELGLVGDVVPTGPTGAIYAYNATRWEGTLGTCIISCVVGTGLPTITSAAGTCVITQ